MSFPKDKAPHNTRVLRSWIRDYAGEAELPERRVHRAVGFMLVALVLDRSLDEEGEHLFIVKGGVSMELRLKLRSRTTKDFDTVYRGTFENWLESLDEALASADIEGFTFSRGEPEAIRDIKTYRVDIIIDFKSNRWGRVQFEVAPVEIPDLLDVDRVEAFDIGQFGLTRPGEVHVVALPYLVAQKLHACTEVPADGEENARAHDLMDLLLARDLLRPDELRRVREACVAIFANRGKQPWPPDVVLYPSWPQVFRRLAEDEDFPITDVNEAAKQVRGLIAEIDAAK